VIPFDSIHRLHADAALRSLDSRLSGLTTTEACARGQEFGPNALERTRGRSAVGHFLAQFTHFFALILWVAAGLAAFAEARSPGSGMGALAAAIVAVVLINGLFSFGDWDTGRCPAACRRR